MIGQRYAKPASHGFRLGPGAAQLQVPTWPGAAGRVAGAAPARRRRADRPASAQPAVAGRERLAQILRRSVLMQLVFAMSLVAFAALLYLAQASQASVLEFNIADLQTEQAQLAAQNASLQADATRLQSLARIDVIATGKLHMTKLDISRAIWVQPVVPHIVPIRPLDADTLTAQRQSQPLAWLERFGAFIKSSL